MVEVVRDMIIFRENKDGTYNVILLLQGHEFGHNLQYIPVSNQKLLYIIDADKLDKTVNMFCQHNDNIFVEGYQEYRKFYDKGFK